jgi:hypothetical protein
VIGVLGKPPITVLQSLASLEGNHDFERVCEWIEGSLEQIRDDTATTADEVRTRWLQGASQALGEFLEKKRTARDILHKMK